MDTGQQRYFVQRNRAGDCWKLKRCADDDRVLFNLNANPHELTNLSQDLEQHERVRSMAARLLTWQKRRSRLCRERSVSIVRAGNPSFPCRREARTSYLRSHMLRTESVSGFPSIRE